MACNLDHIQLVYTSLLCTRIKRLAPRFDGLWDLLDQCDQRESDPTRNDPRNNHIRNWLALSGIQVPIARRASGADVA